MNDRCREFPGDFIQVRNHQQQSLRSGESSGQGPSLEGAVERSGGPAFALHFDHARNAAPRIGFLLGGPLIGPLSHGRRRSNRVNGDDLTEPVGDARDRFISVDGRLATGSSRGGGIFRGRRRGNHQRTFRLEPKVSRTKVGHGQIRLMCSERSKQNFDRWQERRAAVTTMWQRYQANQSPRLRESPLRALRSTQRRPCPILLAAGFGYWCLGFEVSLEFGGWSLEFPNWGLAFGI